LQAAQLIIIFGISHPAKNCHLISLADHPLGLRIGFLKDTICPAFIVFTFLGIGGQSDTLISAAARMLRFMIWHPRGIYAFMRACRHDYKTAHLCIL
jgi:hypothetical protein